VVTIENISINFSKITGWSSEKYSTAGGQSQGAAAVKPV